MRDGWVYELVDQCGWGRALGYVICDLHMWVLDVLDWLRALPTPACTLLLEKRVQAGSTGATLVCVVQHLRNSL